MKSKIGLPRCNFVSSEGKRCRVRSAIKHRVHLDQELYDYPAWVEVSLCPEHFVHLGGKFQKPNHSQTSKTINP